MITRHLHPKATDAVWGYIPGFLSESDPRDAKAQINKNYVFGGWRPFTGFTLSPTKDLLYPGDPPLHPLSRLTFRDQQLYIYPSSWVLCVEPDGTWEVARID